MINKVWVNDVAISENFRLYEFECKDGSHLVKVDPVLCALLQTLRLRLKKPIIIDSGYRSVAYNKYVKGSPKSQHLVGKAVDVRVVGMTPTEVARMAEKIGFTGIGIYKNFTHLDVREVRTHWNG